MCHELRRERTRLRFKSRENLRHTKFYHAGYLCEQSNPSMHHVKLCTTLPRERWYLLSWLHRTLYRNCAAKYRRSFALLLRPKPASLTSRIQSSAEVYVDMQVSADSETNPTQEV